MIAILASNLAKLDMSLSNPGMDFSRIQDSQRIKEIRNDYKIFLSKFSKIGQVSNMVLIYSLILAKRVYKNAYGSYDFTKGDFQLAYACCLFLSIKTVVDSEKWHAEDFETISGISRELVLKTELFLFTKLLGYRLHVSSDEFRSNFLKLAEQVEKRKTKKQIS